MTDFSEGDENRRLWPALGLGAVIAFGLGLSLQNVLAFDGGVTIHNCSESSNTVKATLYNSGDPWDAVPASGPTTVYQGTKEHMKCNDTTGCAVKLDTSGAEKKADHWNHENMYTNVHSSGTLKYGHNSSICDEK